MKLTSLLSQTPYATLSNSCLAKSCALAADGRSRRCAWSLERPRNEDEKKLQSCSTSSSASDGALGAIFHGATCESASRTSKTLRHCGHLCSFGSASVVESQLELVFGHVWCDLLSSEARPCKFVLLYSVARKRFDRTFHSKCPCFRPYNRTCGPDKSAMRIPNLQAITTQSPKDFISGEITSCSVQLLLRIVNVQATHMYPLVHAPWHVHDALDSGPEYLM